MTDEAVIYNPSEIDDSFNYKLYNDDTATYDNLTKAQEEINFTEPINIIQRYRCLTDYLSMTLGPDTAQKHAQYVGMDVWPDIKKYMNETGKKEEAELIEKAMMFCNPIYLLDMVYGIKLKIGEDYLRSVKFYNDTNGHQLSTEGNIIESIMAGAMPLLQKYNPYGLNGFDFEQARNGFRGVPYKPLINPEGLNEKDLEKYEKEKKKVKVDLPSHLRYDMPGEEMPRGMFRPPR